VHYRNKHKTSAFLASNSSQARPAEDRSMGRLGNRGFVHCQT